VPILKHLPRETAHGASRLQCSAGLVGSRIITRIPHLNGIGGQTLQRLLFDGGDDADLQAEVTQSSQIMRFGERCAARYEERREILLGALLGMESCAVGRGHLAAQRRLRERQVFFSPGCPG
jgi:hypothetical protein